MVDIESIDLKDYRHHQEVQLRFNDIDILGHLNNIVYFSLFDLAKARYLQAVRHGDTGYFQKVDCVIANVNCSYLRQVVFQDEIKIATRCLAIGQKSFTLRQVMYNAADGGIHAVCDTVMVCIDTESHKASPMSEELREALGEYDPRP